MPKIRVLVVDDAVVMRRMITEVLAKDPQIEVVGVAANGRIALQKITQVNPDVVTLDVEMPEMDGLATLPELRKIAPKLPVIMFSTITERGGVATLEALARGASDYVTKPANVGSVTEGMARLETELIPKIKTHCRHLIGCSQAASTAAPKISALPSRPLSPAVSSARHAIDIVCIGTSTGGPNALQEVFTRLGGPLPVPIVIVQHMPPVFTRMLAERLGAKVPIKFHEGEEGERVQAGHVYIAPGGKHMEIRRQGLNAFIHLQEGPPENSCRPAVDVLFRSVVAAYGGNTLGVIMTGMGQDGLHGCQALRERGGQIIVQDEASSVVWGMPGYVAQAGLADKVLPLELIAPEIQRRVTESNSARPLAA